MSGPGARVWCPSPRGASSALIGPLLLLGLFASNAPGQSPFLRGDANGDGIVSMADVPAVLDTLLSSGPRSLCPAASDADGDGAVTPADALRVVGYLLGDAPAPPPPFPAFGFPPEPRLPCPLGYAGAPAVNERAFIYVEEASAAPGDTARVRIELRHAPTFHGAALHIAFDPEALAVEEISCPGLGEAAPRVLEGREMAPGEALVTFLSDTPVHPGTVTEVIFRVNPDAGEGARFVNLVGGMGGTEIVQGRESVYPETYGGQIRITRTPLRPPEDLVIAPFGGVPLLRWKSGDRYDRILVERDGGIVAILSGGAEMYADAFIPPGPHSYRVRGMRESERSPGRFARYEGVPIPPPEDFTATPLEVERSVALSWRNGAAYDLLRIERNGELLALIGGRRERFVDAEPAEGLNVYFVSGVVEASESDRSVATVLLVSEPSRFVRGDANMDGTVSLSDVVFLHARLREEAEPPACLDAGDADDDGEISPLDMLAILSALYGDGPPFPPPGIPGGTDPTPDALGCADGRIRWGTFDPANIVWVQSAEAAPGDAISVPVFATTTFEVEAAQVVLTYEARWLEVLGADLEGTVLEELGLEDPEIVLVSDRPEHDYVVLAIPGTGSGGTFTIGPFEARPLLKLRLRVREGARGTIPLVPADCLGPYCLRNEFTRQGRAVYATIYPRTEGGHIAIRGDNPGTLDFLRGDANSDGGVDVGDGIFVANYLYAGGSPPVCPDAADANDDGRLDIGDPITIVMFVMGLRGPMARVCYACDRCSSDLTEDRLPPCGENVCSY